jgi:ABC-type transporter Mla maintaining outer membrane lipid asymmetry ATPase subunit MlaF
MKTTSVVVTHDIPLARLVSDRVAFLEGGRFSFIGSWSDADRTEDPIFSRFLGGLEEEESHVA